METKGQIQVVEGFSRRGEGGVATQKGAESMSDYLQQQELEAERYQEDLKALAECVARGVSDESILQLAHECGIDRRDLGVLLEKTA